MAPQTLYERKVSNQQAGGWTSFCPALKKHVDFLSIHANREHFFPKIKAARSGGIVLAVVLKYKFDVHVLSLNISPLSLKANVPNAIKRPITNSI